MTLALKAWKSAINYLLIAFAITISKDLFANELFQSLNEIKGIVLIYTKSYLMKLYWTYFFWQHKFWLLASCWSNYGKVDISRKEKLTKIQFWIKPTRRIRHGNVFFATLVNEFKLQCTLSIKTASLHWWPKQKQPKLVTICQAFVTICSANMHWLRKQIWFAFCWKHVWNLSFRTFSFSPFFRFV